LPGREYRYRVLYTLEPGQSVVLTNYNYASLKSTITYLRDRYQKRFTTHKQGTGPSSCGGYRKWQTNLTTPLLKSGCP